MCRGSRLASAVAQELVRCLGGLLRQPRIKRPQPCREPRVKGRGAGLQLVRRDAIALLDRCRICVYRRFRRPREVSAAEVTRPAAIDLGHRLQLESPGETVDNAARWRYDHQTGMRADAWSDPMGGTVTSLAVDHIGCIVADTASLRPGRHRRYQRFPWREPEPARSSLPHRPPLA